MQLFYHPECTDPLTLDPVESQHCIKVLRHKKGDKVHIINGKGKLFEGELLNDNFRKCEIAHLKLLREEQEFSHLHIAIAPTKSAERIEWFVEKATEIGIAEISFIKCDNSERPRINIDRLERKAISAIKQNQSLWLPRINPLKPFGDFMTEANCSKKLIAYVETKNNSPQLSSLQLAEDDEVLIMIGPEGDFSPQEIELAVQNDFKLISLGRNVLRTETAGIVACATLLS